MLIIPCYSSARLTPTSLLLTAFSASSTNLRRSLHLQTRFLLTPRPLVFLRRQSRGERMRMRSHKLKLSPRIVSFIARTEKKEEEERGKGEGYVKKHTDPVNNLN